MAVGLTGYFGKVPAAIVPVPRWTRPNENVGVRMLWEMYETTQYLPTTIQYLLPTSELLILFS